jgi:uncharacterized membrane protein
VIVLPQLGHKSLWPDEAYYLKIAGESPGTVAFAARNDFHPPGFLMTQHMMVSLFGKSEFADRLLSGLSWVGVVVLTWLWGAKVFGPKVGWAAGLWAAISFYGLETAANGTSYSFFGFLSVASLFAFWWAVEGKGGVKSWVLYAIAQTACVYTHHYGWGTFAAVNLYFLVTLKGRRKQWFPWLIANVAVLILYLPILGSTISQLSLRVNALAEIRPGGDSVMTILQRLIGVVYHLGAGYVFHGPAWREVMANPLFWLTVVVVFGMAIGGIFAIVRKPKVALFLGIFVVVYLAGMVKSQADILSFPNLAPVYGLLVALAAVTWAGKRWWAAMAPLWIIGAVGYGIYAGSNAPYIYGTTDFRAVAQRIIAESQENDIVMTDLQRTGTAVFEYYYPKKFVARDHFDEYRFEFWVPDVDRGRFQSTTQLKDDLSQAFDNGASGVWYIIQYGLDKSVLKPMQEARDIYRSDLWSNRETMVAKFYPREK